MANSVKALGEVRVTGIEDLERKLRDVPGRIERKVLRGALRAGGIVIRDSARSKVAIRTGSLKKKIVVKEGDPRKYGAAVAMGIGVEKGSFLAIVTPDGRTKFRRLKGIVASGMPQKVTPANYAHLVEFGSAPHQIGNIHHPGAAPHPFFRPAIDTTKAQTLEAIRTDGAARLESEMAKQ